MKNGMLIWNVVLSLVAGVLLFLQLGNRKKNTGIGKDPVKDTTANHLFRMAYFEMDSVEANFTAVKEVKAEIIAKETEYTNSMNQLDQVYKNKYNEYAQKPSMTQEETEAAQIVLKQLGESIKSQKQDIEQKYQDLVMRKNLEIKKKIEDFIKEYNKTKNYSFIVTDDTGLFYFKDSVYNITSEVIKGLNELYRSPKK
jgi:outer membrane protein